MTFLVSPLQTMTFSQSQTLSLWDYQFDKNSNLH